MQALRPGARRRRGRPVRVVTSGPALQLDREVLAALAVGLEAIGLLQKHFPDFYAEQAADCPASPERMLGAIAAFFQLVEDEQQLPLRWPEDDIGELDYCDAPADTLVMYDGVSVEFMSELGHYVYQVRPRYYGLGVQLLIEEGFSTGCPLRLALYHLMRGTTLDIGIELSALVEEAPGLPNWLADELAALRPVSPDVGVHELLMLVAQDIPEAAQLPHPQTILSFAFGQTGNPLADTNEYEQVTIHGGDDLEWWTWEDVPRLAEWSAEAQQIEAAFEAWQRRVIDAGARGVEELGALFQRHARTLRRRDKRQAKTAGYLINLINKGLADDDDDDTTLEALAAEPAAAAAA